MPNIFPHRPRAALPRATGLLLFLLAITACGQLADGQSTPGAGRPPTISERIIDAVINVAADLNFDESDFPADWEVEFSGDGDALLQLIATDSDSSGNAVSVLVERLDSGEAAERALDEALAALAVSDTGGETGVPVRPGDRGVIAPDGDGWVALFRVDNVIASVAADSGGPNAISKAATLNWAERLEARITDRAERGRAIVRDAKPRSGQKPAEVAGEGSRSRPAIFSSEGAAPGLAVAATAIAEARVRAPDIETGRIEQSRNESGTDVFTVPPVAIAPEPVIDQVSPEMLKIRKSPMPRLRKRPFQHLHPRLPPPLHPSRYPFRYRRPRRLLLPRLPTLF